MLLACAFLCGVTQAQVTITEADYEGAPHFVIRTKAATYWYDKAGGGLARLLDRSGKDWIAFHRQPANQYPEAAAAAYRGLPNFVFGGADAGAGHPGFAQCESRQSGKNKITTVSKSGHWQWTWTFTDDHAAVTMEKADPAAAYWFLYEGTVAGTFHPSTHYWGTSDGGPRRETPDHFQRSNVMGQWRWAYFGDDNVARVLFVAQQQPDEAPDQYSVLGNTRAGLASPDGMVIFGFGRAKEPQGLLHAAPQTFYIGFHEQRIRAARQHAALQRRLSKLLAQKN